MKWILLAVLVVMLASVPLSMACSCAIATPREHLENADVVFRGVVLDVDEGVGFFGPETNKIEFRVSTYWKGGFNDERISVRSSASSASCGYVFDKGEEYIVLAHQGDESLWVSSCGGTTSFSDAGYMGGPENYLEILEGVEERLPYPGTPGETLNMILAVSMTALVFLLIGVWLGHRY